jgi:hypothetical protein
VHQINPRREQSRRDEDVGDDSGPTASASRSPGATLPYSSPAVILDFVAEHDVMEDVEVNTTMEPSGQGRCQGTASSSMLTTPSACCPRLCST